MIEVATRCQWDVHVFPNILFEYVQTALTFLTHLTAKLQFNVQLHCFDSVIIFAVGILAVDMYFLGVSQLNMTCNQLNSHMEKNFGKH